MATFKNMSVTPFPPVVAKFFHKGITQEQVADWVGLLKKESGQKISWRRHKWNYLLHASGNLPRAREIINANVHRLERSGGGLAITIIGGRKIL